MTFIGWLLIGSGFLFLWAAIRNYSVKCVITNAVTGKTSDCTNK